MHKMVLVAVATNTVEQFWSLLCFVCCLCFKMVPHWTLSVDKYGAYLCRRSRVGWSTISLNAFKSNWSVLLLLHSLSLNKFARRLLLLLHGVGVFSISSFDYATDLECAHFLCSLRTVFISSPLCRSYRHFLWLLKNMITCCLYFFYLFFLHCNFPSGSRDSKKYTSDKGSVGKLATKTRTPFKRMRRVR